ncbi:TraI domain-containing protein [Janthinobacterium lividum]
MQNFMLPASSSDLIASEATRISEIHTAAGVPEKVFSRFYLPVLLAYMDHVQKMPLSNAAFSRPGGAIDFGLTSALISLRLAGTQMFNPTLASEERRVLEPQCRFAAFAATMATGVVLLSENTLITTRDNDVEYHPLVSPVPLSVWLAQHPVSMFTWRKGAQELTQSEGAAIAARFMPNGILNNFDLRVSLMLYNAINPKPLQNGIESTIARVVRQTISKVITHHVQVEERQYQERGSDVHYDPAADLCIKADAFMQDDMIGPGGTIESIESPLQTAPATHHSSALPGGTVRNIENNDKGDALLNMAHPVLREWFQMLSKHENFPKLKELLKVSERGIAVPITMLGAFGVAGTSIRKMMVDADLIVDRTEDGRGILLKLQLQPWFMGGS